MAGARPSAFRKGGGFLNDVDGVITGYQFTTEFNGKAGKRNKNGFLSLYAALSVRVDGSDEDVTTHLFVGSADDWEISDDGLTLTPAEGKDGEPLNVNLNGKAGFGLFIASLVDKGFPETNLSETETNFEPIIGWRVRFAQQVNEASNKKSGKRKDKKTGKEYDRTDVVVSQVYGPAQGNKGAGKSTARPTGKTTTSRSSKPAGKSNGKIQESDLTEDADTVLLEILGDKDGEVARRSLSIEVTKRRMKDPNRDAIRELIYSEGYLTSAEERGLIGFDQKTQTISAA